MDEVRKFIRDAQSREWLTKSGFSADRRGALSVESFSQAHEYCRDHRERKLELVICLPDGNDEMVLPMDDSESEAGV